MRLQTSDRRRHIVAACANSTRRVRNDLCVQPTFRKQNKKKIKHDVHIVIKLACLRNVISFNIPSPPQISISTQYYNNIVYTRLFLSDIMSNFYRQRENLCAFWCSMHEGVKMLLSYISAKKKKKKRKRFIENQKKEWIPK